MSLSSGGGSRVSKRRSRSSVASHKSGAGGGRESPIGAEREREFPTTKIGASSIQQPDQSAMGGNNDGAGGHDRGYINYHNHGLHGGRCAGSHNNTTPSVQSRSVITGDLVQSRDFHYTVEQPPPAPLYRRPREVVAYPSGGGGGQSGHMSSRSRNDSRADYAYVEHKHSPYHTGTLRTSVRGLSDEQRVSVRNDDSIRVRGSSEEGLRAGRLDQNYMMVRAQSRLQDGYDRMSHRSDSRGDLLDNDHSSIYDHGLYYQPGQYNGFVRTCDGKFIRTNIPPQHDFETLDTNFYRNSSTAMHHTIRRPTKNRHQSHGNNDYCCPSRDGDAGVNIRASDQLQQSYATLRGRKYSEKTCGRGIGDNYGRNTLTPNFLDDARSVHSLADDIFFPGGNTGHTRSSSQTQHSHSKTLSRSTDKSLDSVGLDDDANDVLTNFTGLGLAAGLANLRSDDILATMLKREPPDGKEKPEPPKHQKLENNSRKNSKCDLLEPPGHQQGGRGGGDAVDGGQAASLHSQHANLAKSESQVSKRDSLSANIKETVPPPAPAYLDSGNVQHDEDLVSERLKDW